MPIFVFLNDLYYYYYDKLSDRRPVDVNDDCVIAYYFSY
jgi:hypothetical protein